MRKHHETAVGIIPFIVAAAPIAMGVGVGVVIKIKSAISKGNNQ
jgi:hypothetical protein